jgi:hypothetical protein
MAPWHDHRRAPGHHPRSGAHGPPGVARPRGQFLGNRDAWALHLDAQFHQFSQGDFSVEEYCRQMKGLADSLRDLGEPMADRTLVLNLLRGLSPRYGHLKTLIKRTVPLPTFHMPSGMSFYSRSSPWPSKLPPRLRSSTAPLLAPRRLRGGGGAGPPLSIDRDPRSVSHCGSYGPSSAFHHLRCPSPTQGRTWGRRLLSWRFHRPGWRPELAVVLQPLDRHHLHVAGSSPQRLPSSGAGAALLTTPSYCTPTLPAYGMPSYDVPPTTPTPPALPPTGTPTPTPGSPFAGGWDPASFAAAYNTMALAPSSSDWVIDSGASYHVTPTTGMLSHSHPSPSTHPTLIVVGNSSTLPVTSVGASVLPGPFYLNYVLVAPHITHNLLSVCRFTTDNSCSIEFDPSGFSVKDLATRTPLHTPTHFHRRVSTSHPGHHLTSSSRPSRT